MESKQFGVTRSYAPNHILAEAQCFHKVAGRTPLGTTTPNSCSHFLVTWFQAQATPRTHPSITATTGHVSLSYVWGETKKFM